MCDVQFLSILVVSHTTAPQRWEPLLHLIQLIINNHFVIVPHFNKILTGETNT